MIREWSLLICAASMASTIFELILPPGKMEKTLRTVLGVFMIYAIISPFASIKNSWNMNIKKISSGDIGGNKTGFVEKINDQIKFLSQKNVRKVVQSFLRDSGIKYEKVEIFMDTDDGKNISITKCKIYIEKNDEGLKEKIKSGVEKKLKINTEISVK